MRFVSCFCELRDQRSYGCFAASGSRGVMCRAEVKRVVPLANVKDQAGRAGFQTD